jgi:hypothetical protein
MHAMTRDGPRRRPFAWGERSRIVVGVSVSALLFAVACGRTMPGAELQAPAEPAVTSISTFERLACGSESMFPRAQVQASDPSILDDAWRVLGDQKKEECLIRAVLVLGTLGGEREAGWLHSLLLERTSGPVSRYTSSGLYTVPLALAYIATRHSGEPFARSIADQLLACSSSGYWVGRLPWTDRTEGVAEQNLTVDCIDALGSLEFPGVAARLERISEDTTRSAREREQAQSALERYRRVQALGGLVRAWQASD